MPDTVIPEIVCMLDIVEFRLKFCIVFPETVIFAGAVTASTIPLKAPPLSLPPALISVMVLPVIL